MKPYLAKIDARTRNLKLVLFLTDILLTLPLNPKRQAAWCNRLLSWVWVEYRVDRGRWRRVSVKDRIGTWEVNEDAE